MAYLNVDITAGQEFGAGAAPALDKLLMDKHGRRSCWRAAMARSDRALLRSTRR